MIAAIRQFFVFLAKPKTGFFVRVYFAVGRALGALLSGWWKGMHFSGRALREENEALDRIRDRWRSR